MRRTNGERVLRKCSCGMVVNMSEAAHSRTRSHDLAPQVARWLDEGLEISEISTRTGLGNTMVRRIAICLGKFETRRISVAVGQDIFPDPSTLLGDLAKWAANFGLRVMYAHTSTDRGHLAKRVFAGGHLCAVTTMSAVNLHPKIESYRLQRPRPDDYDFVLGRLENGKWAVIPFEKIPLPVMSVNVAWGGSFAHYIDAVHQIHEPPRRLMLTDK